MTDAQRRQSDLETERDAASDCGLADRIEATLRVLKWLDDQALEQPEACTLHQDVNLLLGKTPSLAR